MAYRRRVNPVVKICIKCKSPFETWHIGRIYCSQACNMTAWRHRHKDDKESATVDQSTKNNLSFSLPNLATIATGSLAATAVTNILSSEPSQQEVIDLINNLTYNVSRSMGSITERLNQIDDFTKAVMSTDPGLSIKVKSTRQRRLSSGKK